MTWDERNILLYLRLFHTEENVTDFGIACPVVSAIMASIPFSIFELNASAARRLANMFVTVFDEILITTSSHLFSV